MSQVVQANCPGCKRPLRIPADWLSQALRCKHCGMLVQVKGKSPTPQPPRRERPPALPPLNDAVAEPIQAVRPLTPTETDPPFPLPDTGPIVRVSTRYRRSHAGR